MTVTELDARTEARATIYKLLGEMYHVPTESLSVLVQQLHDIFGEYDPQLCLLCEQMNKVFDDENLEVDAFVIEHAKLFIGPFKLTAPPFSSIYLEDKWEVNGRSTVQVERFYEQAGLTITSTGHQPLDHISVQFEFMYYLNFKWLETGDLFYKELQKEFLYRILNYWIPKFNQAIQDGSTIDFYKLLGNLTEQFIVKEINTL